MYTSSFFSKAALANKNKCVVISRGVANGWNGTRKYVALAPSWDLVNFWNRTHDEETYTKRYYAEVLSKLDTYQVYHELGDDAILLCYCKSGAFCHRRLVAEWFKNELGIEVKEV